MTIKKCKCGSTTFDINEGIVHRASINEDGELTVYKVVANEIETIDCQECGAEYSESDFKQVNF